MKRKLWRKGGNPIMGTDILKFAGTFERAKYLKDFSCPNCQQTITEQDIEAKNYQLGVSDYANEINKEFTAGRLNIPLYSLTFWLKSVEHQECPEQEVSHE